MLDLYTSRWYTTSTLKKGDMPMTLETVNKRAEAIEFLGGMRGQYIVAQALHYAIKSLESV